MSRERGSEGGFQGEVAGEERCGACRYYRGRECRRFPPAMVEVDHHFGVDMRTRRPEPRWPQVHPVYGWCGEFRALSPDGAVPSPATTEETDG